MHQPLPAAHKVIVVVANSQVVHHLRMVNDLDQLHLAIAAIGFKNSFADGQIARRDPALVLRVEWVVGRGMQRLAVYRQIFKCEVQMHEDGINRLERDLGGLRVVDLTITRQGSYIRLGKVLIVGASCTSYQLPVHLNYQLAKCLRYIFHIHNLPNSLYIRCCLCPHQ